MHGGDGAVGIDGEADEGGAALVERGAGFFGQQGEPLLIDKADDALEVGIEVDALGVGEDVYARACGGAAIVAADADVAVVAGIATLRFFRREKRDAAA